MSVTRTEKPRLARPRKELRIDTSVSEAFLRLPMQERERRLDEAGKMFREAFSNVSVDDLIAEKRREALRDG